MRRRKAFAASDTIDGGADTAAAKGLRPCALMRDSYPVGGAHRWNTGLALTARDLIAEPSGRVSSTVAARGAIATLLTNAAAAP